MKQVVTLRLPGKLGHVTNFTPEPSGVIRLDFSGAKVIEVMEQRLLDDGWVTKNAAHFRPGKPPAWDNDLNESLYGSNAPVQAVVTGATTPLFDYAAELAEAQKDFARLQKSLGLSAASIVPPAQGGTLKSLQVLGVRLVAETDKKRGIRPFNYDAGYTLALFGELPGSVLAVTSESTMETALADDGSNLLPDSKWERKIHFPKLTDDKTGVLFEVKLRPPGRQVKGLQELSGQLQYSVAGGLKEIDLGFDALKPGAIGTELGAQIVSIDQASRKDGSWQMALKLHVRKEGLKTVWVELEGLRTVLEQRGYSGGSNAYTFTYEGKRAFPGSARIVVEIFDQVQIFNAPFKLENISLLGAPLAQP